MTTALRRCVQILGILAVTSAPANVVGAVTYFAFDSAPSSWVGQGFTDYFVSPSNGWNISASTNAAHSVVQISIDRADGGSPPWNNYYWDLILAAPNGNAIAPGTYLNATRYPFQAANVPGLSLTGNHRGDNTLTGHFQVLEAVYSGTTVQSFAVNFTQYDEGIASWWIVGELRFNSSVPEPTSLSLAGIALTGLGLRLRRGR